MGGEERFVRKLDSLFILETTDEKYKHVEDIAGLIGQYAHGNEPSHHVVYLYAYAGEQWKTAEKVRFILENLYSDLPDGICGNEDCGQMSAWYVFSSLGFYPVNPVNGVYVLGSPLNKEATLHLENDMTFTVKTINNTQENIYIQSATLNGKPYEKSFITHSDLLKGGILEIILGPQPNKKFGYMPGNRPYSRKVHQ